MENVTVIFNNFILSLVIDLMSISGEITPMWMDISQYWFR